MAETYSARVTYPATPYKLLVSRQIVVLKALMEE